MISWKYLFYSIQFLSCLNNTATIQITVSFSDAQLKPKEETTAVLLMSKLSGLRTVDTISLLSGLTSSKFLHLIFISSTKTHLKIVIINGTDKCLVYKTYQVCLNSGFCTVFNNEPTCECPSFASYTLTGPYCEIKTIIVTTPSMATKATPVDNTLLIVEIVLPIIAFIIILTLTMVIVYYCYRR